MLLGTGWPMLGKVCIPPSVDELLLSSPAASLALAATDGLSAFTSITSAINSRSTASVKMVLLLRTICLRLVSMVPPKEPNYVR